MTMRPRIGLVVLAAIGCGGGGHVSVREVGEDRAGRVAAVARIVGQAQAAPPSPILDAHLLEQTLGDGVLGPADVRRFFVVDVGPKDAAAWMEVLTPLAPPPAYEDTPRPCAWWVGRPAFATLAFFEPKALTGRAHGWVGVDAASGRIFVYSFTA